MRKIIPRHVEERKNRRNKVILGISLIALMLLSTIGYSVQYIFGNDAQADQQTLNYKGFNFIQQNGFWVLNLNVGNFIFSHNPNEAKKISGSVKTLENYRNKKLYIYSENIEAESEIRINMAQFAESIERACPEGMQCESSIQIKTCDENFIIIKSGSEKIMQEKNCVFIEGNDEDLVKITDGFLLKVIGIDS